MAAIAELSISREELFGDWLLRLLEDAYGVQQHTQGEPRTIHLKNGVILHATTQPDLGVRTEPPGQEAGFEELVSQARSRTDASDLGQGVWWTVTLAGRFGIDFMSDQMMRVMSEEQLFRGAWRLGPKIALKFDPGEIEGPAPRGMRGGTLRIETTFWTQGPSHGLIAGRIAGQLGPLIRTLCVYATGVPFDAPAGVFPAKEDPSGELANAPEIAVAGVQLFPAVMQFGNTQNKEAIDRLLGALYSYEAAIAQKAGSVALILFVTALEALSVPNAPWRQERVTARFIGFISELCPAEVDTILAHGNFAQVFGNYSSPRRFLSELYDLRSSLAHTGLTPHAFGRLMNLTMDAQIRVALASELARAAIHRFLTAPRSSLIGHPGLAEPESEGADSGEDA
jgi:hypothetical protein